MIYGVTGFHEGPPRATVARIASITHTHTHTRARAGDGRARRDYNDR